MLASTGPLKFFELYKCTKRRKEERSSGPTWKVLRGLWTGNLSSSALVCLCLCLGFPCSSLIFKILSCIIAKLWKIKCWMLENIGVLRNGTE